METKSSTTTSRIDLRVQIFREVIGNICAHSDYQPGFGGYLEIFYDRVITRNATRLIPTIREGLLTLDELGPYTKNPLIVRVLNELHFVEDLGSGRRNIKTYAPDAANANWGGDWRMPTKEDQDELRNECIWTWEQKNGVNGYTVTGPNGNSIFLPAAGCSSNSDSEYAGSHGFYWSSSLFTNNSHDAYYLIFDSGSVSWTRNGRFYGLSVRPVL